MLPSSLGAPWAGLADVSTTPSGHLAVSLFLELQQASLPPGSQESLGIFFLTFYFVLGYSRLTNNAVIVSG